MKTTQLAYLAGLFDGEGSFSIQISSRVYKGRKSIWCNPRMTMTLSHGHGVLSEMQQAFGGQLYDYLEKDRCVRWNLSKRHQLLSAAKSLFPYLRIKKQIASRFMEALNLFPKKRANHGLGERSWTAEHVQKIAEIAFSLNPQKSRKCVRLIASIKRLKSDIYDPDNYRPSGRPTVANKNSKTGVLGVTKHYQRTGKFYYCAIACKGKQRLSKYFPGTPEGLKQAESQAKLFREQLRKM